MRMDLGNVGKLEPFEMVGSKIIWQQTWFLEYCKSFKKETYGLSVDYNDCKIR